jgi:hypothetical protein
MRPNINKAPAFRSELDKELIRRLSPLRTHEAVVHFPFFANTFPLAFHYFCRLKDGGATEDQINRKIKLILWGDERHLIEDKEQQLPLIVYSTTSAIENIRYLDKVHVTNFLPKLVFSEFNLRAWNASGLAKKHHEPAQKQFKDVMAAFVNEDAFEFYEVFTEIPDQAKALFEQLFKGLNLELGKDYDVIGTKDAKWLFDETHLERNTLRLFLYGAPLTSYFDRKRQRYIPFNVKLDGAKKSFETVVAIKGNPAERKAIHKAIDDYHTLLYEAANEEREADRQSFRAVQFHYNRVARLLQHRSSFPSSQEYAKCLADHHQLPERQQAARRR